MNENNTSSVRYGVIVLLAVVVMGGGYFVFGTAGNTEVPASTPSAPAESMVKETKRSGSPPLISTGNIINAYNFGQNAILTKTDILFDDATTVSPKLKVRTAETVRLRIEALRSNITDILNDWRNLINNLPSTPTIASPDTATLANQYADQVRDFILELVDLVEDLTPENSGLTPEEIEIYQDIVADAVSDVDDALDVVGGEEYDQGDAETTTENDDANNTGDDESSAQDDTDVPPSEPSPEPPPPPYVPPLPPAPPVYQPDDTGEPRLIEGSNPIM